MHTRTHARTHTHTHTHTHLNVYPEHEGAVTAVGVSEDGLKVLAGTSSVSQTLL